VFIAVSGRNFARRQAPETAMKKLGMKLGTCAFTAALTLTLAGCYSAPAASASGQTPPSSVSVQNGMLVGANGMTLYTFDKDTAGSGKSVCNGPCATNWPPLMGTQAPSGGNYSVIQRDDGSSQIAYKGKPLYYWSKDGKPGDTTGDGVMGAWHTARP
jgi:predicted lipoprotein with Yx(FWY)xxD motif